MERSMSVQAAEQALSSLPTCTKDPEGSDRVAMQPYEGMQVYTTDGEHTVGRIAHVGPGNRVVVRPRTGRAFEAVYGEEVRPTSYAGV